MVGSLSLCNKHLKEYLCSHGRQIVFLQSHRRELIARSPLFRHFRLFPGSDKKCFKIAVNWKYFLVTNMQMSPPNIPPRAEFRVGRLECLCTCQLLWLPTLSFVLFCFLFLLDSKVLVQGTNCDFGEHSRSIGASSLPFDILLHYLFTLS